MIMTYTDQIQITALFIIDIFINVREYASRIARRASGGYISSPEDS